MQKFWFQALSSWLILLLLAACSDSGTSTSNSNSKDNPITRDRAAASPLCTDPIGLAGTFANSHLGADGTTVPFIICTPAQLRNMYLMPGKNFELGGDVTFTSAITPVQAAFKGVLDGKGFKILGVSISRAGSADIGIFKEAEDAEIKNITFENFTVSGYERTGTFAGTARKGITLQNVTIKNVSVTGITQTGGLFGAASADAVISLTLVMSDALTVAGNNQTGGLFGLLNEGATFTAEDLTLKATVNGLAMVGGVIGQAGQASFTDINFQGNVQALKTHAGGLVGILGTGVFNGVTHIGKVESPFDAVEIFLGGVVGLVTTSATFTDVDHQGIINAGGDHIGGIAGRVQQGSFTRLTSSGTLTVLDDRYASIRRNVGGLVGHIVLASPMVDSSSSMTINAEAQYVGGLVGYYQDFGSSVRRCQASGNVTGRYALIGGAFGLYDGDILEDTTASGNVIVDRPTPNAYVGGLAGYTNSKVLEAKNLHATGHVTAQNGTADYLGGLVGFLRAGNLRDSWAKGNVTGARNFVGGLVGIARGAIENSYALGNVTGSLRYIGGLAGAVTLTGSVTRSFAVGNVSGADLSGGLVGWVSTTATSNTVTHSYAYGQTTKAVGSAYPDLSFGPIIGSETTPGMVDALSVYYRSALRTGTHNALGKGLADNRITSSVSYGFDFDAPAGWRMPTATTVLPGRAGYYPWPLPAWVGVDTAPLFRVGGTVTGLAFESVQLRLNGEETITIAAGATTFNFNRRVQQGSTYEVELLAGPTNPAITCTIGFASGTMLGADIDNVAVVCPTLSTLTVIGAASMLSGSSQTLAVTGTFSNAQSFDVTSFASLSRSGTTFTLSGTTLTAPASGSTTVTASWLSRTGTLVVSAGSAPVAPTLPNWQNTSPSAVTAQTARWTRTASSINGQFVDYYLGDACPGSPLSSATVSTSASTAAFTGTDGLSYSFKVRVTNTLGFTSSSACSSTLQIILPTPDPVSSPAIAATWIRGALPQNAPLVSWVNPASGVTAVEIALGSTSGGAEVRAWGNIGLVTSRTVTTLNGISACAPIYPSLRTVNSVNKRSSVVTAPFFRWDNTVPTTPGVPAASGTASTTAAPTFTWTASTDNCVFNRYEMAIGTTAGATNTTGGWMPIGNVVSYRAQNGVDGFALALASDTAYFTSVRAIDAAGNISAVSTSSSWILPTNLDNRVFWYDAQELASVLDRSGVSAEQVGFSERVATWSSLGTTAAMDATSPALTNDPDFDLAHKRLSLNGTAHYLNVPSNADYDSATFKTRNVFVSFKTSSNTTTRQVIYEQGTTSRGLNLYVLNGLLYCAFWNTVNDGDGAQAVVSANTALSAGAIHHAAVVMDYTNYTGTSGPNGAVRCYLDGAQFGSNLSITSRLFTHGGSSALGATVGGTRYHDTTSSTTTGFFAGSILEAFSFLEHPDTASVISTLNDQLEKWNASDLDAPGNLKIANNSTTSAGVDATWTAIPNGSFTTDHYEMAIGTTAGGDEAMGWTDIGNVLSYRPVDGVDGVALTLSVDTDYYTSVRAVNASDVPSLAATSPPWRVVPASSTLLAGTVLRLDAQNTATVKDANSISAETGGFLGVVATWVNAITAGTSNFVQATAANRPTYDAITKGLRFDRANDSLSTPSSATLFNTTSTQKSITAVFTTGTDATTRQFVFEAGGNNTRGMSIYLEAGQLYCLFHNTSNGGDGAQTRLHWSSSVNPMSTYVVTLYLDYRNYTTTTGPSGTVGCSVNGVSLGTSATTSRLYADTSTTYVGVRSAATWHNSNSTGTGDYFGGTIHEVQISSQAPADLSTLHQFQSALMQKWL